MRKMTEANTTERTDPETEQYSIPINIVEDVKHTLGSNVQPHYLSGVTGSTDIYRFVDDIVTRDPDVTLSVDHPDADTDPSVPFAKLWAVMNGTTIAVSVAFDEGFEHNAVYVAGYSHIIDPLRDLAANWRVVDDGTDTVSTLYNSLNEEVEMEG